MAIRRGRLADSTLVARYLGINPWGVVAAPEYLARRAVAGGRLGRARRAGLQHGAAATRAGCSPQPTGNCSRPPCAEQMLAWRAIDRFDVQGQDKPGTEPARSRVRQSAVDYLMKPLSAGRLAMAFERVKTRLLSTPSSLNGLLNAWANRFVQTSLYLVPERKVHAIKHPLGSITLPIDFGERKFWGTGSDNHSRGH